MSRAIDRRAVLRLAGLAGLGAASLGASGSGAPSGAQASLDLPPLTELESTEPERLLAVITKTIPIEPLDYEPPDLVTLPDGIFQVRAEVADQLGSMLAAAADEGIALTVISGYRDFATQAGTHEDWVRRVGREQAERRSAQAGHSEHQTGLAVDLDDGQGCYLNQCFGETTGGEWAAAHAHRYGFMLSFPAWASERTGFSYEPWHFRYVGPRAAAVMRAFEIDLLEDYVGSAGRAAGLGRHLGRD